VDVRGLGEPHVAALARPDLVYPLIANLDGREHANSEASARTADGFYFVGDPDGGVDLDEVLTLHLEDGVTGDFEVVVEREFGDLELDAKLITVDDWPLDIRDRAGVVEDRPGDSYARDLRPLSLIDVFILEEVLYCGLEVGEVIRPQRFFVQDGADLLSLF